MAMVPFLHLCFKLQNQKSDLINQSIFHRVDNTQNIKYIIINVIVIPGQSFFFIIVFYIIILFIDGFEIISLF